MQGMMLFSMGYETKSLVPSMDYLFSSCWSVGSHNPQTLQAIVIALGYPPEIDGKILAFIVPEISIYGTWGEYYPAVNPANYSTQWPGKTGWCNCGMNVMAITIHFDCV